MSIYFIHAKGTRLVKIGYAADPWRRLNKIQCDTPRTVKMLAVEPGGREREDELHVQFKASRHRGEWFLLTDDLKEYIAQLPPMPSAQEAPINIGTHADLIVALGDTSTVATTLGLRDNRVSNWKQRGIAWRYRPRVAALARRKRVALPEGFLA